MSKLSRYNKNLTILKNQLGQQMSEGKKNYFTYKKISNDKIVR